MSNIDSTMAKDTIHNSLRNAVDKTVGRAVGQTAKRVRPLKRDIINIIKAPIEKETRAEMEPTDKTEQ